MESGKEKGEFLKKLLEEDNSVGIKIFIGDSTIDMEALLAVSITLWLAFLS